MLILAFVLLSCRGTTNGRQDSTALATSEASYALPGFNEKILIGDEAGKLVLLNVGDTLTKRNVSGSLGSMPVASLVDQGLAMVLTAKGDLCTIDSQTASITKTVKTKVKNPSDFLIESPTVGYIANSSKGTVIRFDPTSGAALDTFDLSSQTTSPYRVSLGKMLRVGNRLLVQIQRKKPSSQQPIRGAIAVFDTDAKNLIKVVELEVPDPNAQAKKQGFNPDGAMIWDQNHNQVFITAKGNRPSNTGMIVKLNLASLELDPWFKNADAGFQGPIALGSAQGSSQPEMFVAYHTSTPVASTHLFHGELKGDGSFNDIAAGALVDALEEIDGFPTNKGSTLLAFRVLCNGGGPCLGGAGISFVNMQTSVVYPRLLSAEIDIEPLLVLFL